MKGTQTEIFRGDLEESVRHYAEDLARQAPKGSKGAAEVKKPMAGFCGVAVSTVTRWLHGNNLPLGEERIKLMCFLDVVGYKVVEFEKLERTKKGRRFFAELIGFGLLTVQQAAELLGYSSTSTLLQVLQGHHGASDDKDAKMWQVWKERKDELEGKKEEAGQKYRPKTSPETVSQTVPKGEPRPVAAAAEPSGTPSSLAGAANGVMEALLFLLDLSPGESLESELSINSVLRLSSKLSDISSKLLRLKGGG